MQNFSRTLLSYYSNNLDSQPEQVCFLAGKYPHFQLLLRGFYTLAVPTIKISYKQSLLALLLFVTTLISGCGSENGFVAQPIPTAFIRVVNAIPDSPGFIIEFEKQSIGVTNFGESTAIVGVIPEVHRDFRVLFVENGDTSILIHQEFEILKDNLLTIVVAGTMAAPELIAVNDAPIDFADGTTNSELRFVNASRNAPETVSFHLTDDINIPGAPIASLPRNTASELLNIEPAGVQHLLAMNSNDNQIIWDSGDTEIPPSARPFFVLIDYFGPGDKVARVISLGITSASNFPNEDLPGSLRFVNMMADRGLIDFYLNDQLLAEDLLFSDVSNYKISAPGSYTVKVTTADVPDDIILEDDIELGSGQYGSLIAAGLVDNYSLVASIDDLRRISSRAKLVILQLAPTLGAADAYILKPGETVEDNLANLGQLQSPNVVNTVLEEDVYSLSLTTTNTKTVVLGPERLNLSNNGLYRVYLTDALGGGEPAQIFLGDDFDANFNP